MKIKWNSIQNKLFFTVSMSSTIIILSLILLNNIVLKSFYLYAKYNEIKEVYNEINYIYNNSKNVSNEDVFKIAIENNIQILIENDNGYTEFSSNNSFMEAINKNRSYIHSKDNRKLLFSNKNISVSLVSYNTLNCVLLSGKLDNGYHIYIQIPLSPIEESVKISNRLLLMMGIIIIIIASIIASIISRSFTSPILQLTQITSKMANLDFSEKYENTESNDEICELGNNINTMSSKLEKTIKQLRNNNNQLEKDIEEKSKIDEMRKQFISDVSHELKTPIGLIQGYAEGLLENVNSDEKSRKYYAEIIIDESNRMDRLVKQLLELMKIEYGKMEFNNNVFDICELIREVINRCKMISDEKGVTIEFKQSKPIEVYADAFYIEQAFTNYVTNAIKHVHEMYGDKQITVKVKVNNEKKNVRISVFNTGKRIEEENIDKIWGRFYKIDESRNRNDGGTGIGLSLVKAIMTSYGFKYGVKNRDNGVEFYFDIPLANE